MCAHQSPSLGGLLTVRVTEQYFNSNVGKCALRQFSEPLEVHPLLSTTPLTAIKFPLRRTTEILVSLCLMISSSSDIVIIIIVVVVIIIIIIIIIIIAVLDGVVIKNCCLNLVEYVPCTHTGRVPELIRKWTVHKRKPLTNSMQTCAHKRHTSAT